MRTPAVDLLVMVALGPRELAPIHQAATPFGLPLLPP